MLGLKSATRSGTPSLKQTSYRPPRKRRCRKRRTGAQVTQNAHGDSKNGPASPLGLPDCWDMFSQPDDTAVQAIESVYQPACEQVNNTCAQPKCSESDDGGDSHISTLVGWNSEDKIPCEDDTQGINHTEVITEGIPRVYIHGSDSEQNESDSESECQDEHSNIDSEHSDSDSAHNASDSSQDESEECSDEDEEIDSSPVTHNKNWMLQRQEGVAKGAEQGDDEDGWVSGESGSEMFSLFGEEATIAGVDNSSGHASYQVGYPQRQSGSKHDTRWSHHQDTTWSHHEAADDADDWLMQLDTPQLPSSATAYAFPKVRTSDIDDVTDFWETDFQVGGRIIPRMSCWESRNMAPEPEVDPEDHERYNLLKALYARWVECNHSKEQWYRKYRNMSLNEILKFKTRKRKMSPGLGSCDSLGDTTSRDSSCESHDGVISRDSPSDEMQEEMSQMVPHYTYSDMT